jgi:hypothetical protein
MDDLPIKKGQSSVRFSILNEQSAMKTAGSNKLGAIGSSRSLIVIQARTLEIRSEFLLNESSTSIPRRLRT